MTAASPPIWPSPRCQALDAKLWMPSPGLMRTLESDDLRSRIRHLKVGFCHCHGPKAERAANDKECEIPGHHGSLSFLHAGSDSRYSPLREMKCGVADVPHEIPMSSRPLSSRPSKCRQPMSCRLMSVQRNPLWV